MLAVVGVAWQVVGVKGQTLNNTTAFPLAGPIAGGVLILVAWVWARRAIPGESR